MRKTHCANFPPPRAQSILYLRTLLGRAGSHPNASKIRIHSSMGAKTSVSQQRPPSPHGRSPIRPTVGCWEHTWRAIGKHKAHLTPPPWPAVRRRLRRCLPKSPPRQAVQPHRAGARGIDPEAASNRSGSFVPGGLLNFGRKLRGFFAKVLAHATETHTIFSFKRMHIPSMT